MRLTIQLNVDHDVEPQLFLTQIVDWVTIEDLLYNMSIQDNIDYVHSQYTEEYINKIPDLIIYLDMLEQTKKTINTVLGDRYTDAKIVGVFDSIVLVSFDYKPLHFCD